MSTQPSMPRSTRSQSPSAKFYSRTFSKRDTAQDNGQGTPSEDNIVSAPQSKRRKLNPGSDTDTAVDERMGRHRAVSGKSSQYRASRQRDAAQSKRVADDASSCVRVPRAGPGVAYTKRASALNLHNYPTDHHPVGVAIWVIQKIDSARRERVGSASSRESSPEAFAGPSPSGGAFQASGQASELDEAESPGDRRQAQRERKIKQRLENWAKNKENDVVARAKLDAKKKFGSNPSTQSVLLGNGQLKKPSPSDEKEAYIRKRIRDDFTRLMRRQTKVFADEVSKLEPFQVGFSKKCFPAPDSASDLDVGLVTAGTLLVDVLPALAEKEVSRTSQLAADALVQALETGSVSPESFFDALAILAQNTEILAGSDRVLTQLFSRSSCSGNTKALRTSSGGESKLFATTNGSFIIYNTIENTEVAASLSSRYPTRSFVPTDSISARASARQRKPRSSMLGVSEVSSSPRTRTSMSPRISPPKALKLTRPSKLRGSVSFATSPSPPPPRVKLTDKPVSADQDPKNVVFAPKLEQAGQRRSLNEYLSKQLAPPRPRVNDQSSPQTEISDDLIKNLLDLAFLASQEDTDEEFEAGVHETSVPNGAAEAEPIRSLEPSPGRHNDELHSSNPHVPLKPTARGNLDTTTPAPALPVSPEQVANFHRFIHQLPTGENNFQHENAGEIAALYDQIAQGPAFERAKELGFSYPELPRPFTDRDGWRHTGVVNEFGEEIVEIDRHRWIYSPECPGEIQQPLRRLRRKTQLEQERIYGFPPVAGNGNEPRPQTHRQERDGENVAYEKLMFDIRKAAEVRGLPCDRSLSWEHLAESIKTFDASYGINVPETIPAPDSKADPNDGDDSASTHVEASEISEIDGDDDSDYEPDQAAKYHVEGSWRSSNGAHASPFVDVNGRRESLRKLRDRPSSSSPAQRNQNRTMDISAVLDPSHADMSPHLRPTASSPPTSTTKYDVRPPNTCGTFNTFNGPVTSSNTPTASPTGTLTFMKLNFNVAGKQAPTSPGANSNLTSSRRPSTISLSASSLASRHSSTQPLDIDNTIAYNAAKGYNTNTSNSPAQTTIADPGSPTNGEDRNGLNGGFPGGGIIINAPDKRGDGRGQRKKSKAPDFKMTVRKAGKEGPKVQATAVRGGTVLKFP